jgi:hypothetical protein
MSRTRAPNRISVAVRTEITERLVAPYRCWLAAVEAGDAAVQPS